MTTGSCLMLQDTMVICNFNGTLMNKDIWGDPDVFRPDRFIDSKGSVVIPDQYTPFGFGKLLPPHSGSSIMCTPNFKIYIVFCMLFNDAFNTESTQH
jgi:hypothetical protein